ncbi:site-specific recombinase XerD [Kribbella pratensis]|uniref:Site-specific recombinase XerD n=2 Tax=Kribbella pratensis TaxID=2512112 RepID=A0ABY2FR86_9ACTN|nr:site-specific recombinase XerD [Kribbella pratensis]
MAFVKDLWTTAVEQADGSVKRERNAKRWGRGKRWLAVWIGPDGREKSRTFDTKVRASRFASEMETDVARGEYVDPQAGTVRFEVVAKSWLGSRVVDPTTEIRHETAWRLHVLPVFGKRQVKSIKPSEVANWLADLERRKGPATARTAFVVLHGTLELAVDDDTIKRNPAKAGVVTVPVPKNRRIVTWSDATVERIVECHPVQYRAIPTIGAAAGLRQGELFGLAKDDIDFDAMVIHVRRQVKKIGKYFVFALPKNDLERTVPMSEGAALTLMRHMESFEPRPYSLPWERPNGEPHEVKILFRWRNDRHIPARSYDKAMWHPALAAAGVIPQPTRNARGALQYVTNRDTGMHALRHYYASVALADGVNIKELAEYLGHGDPGFTLRLYTHMLPSSHDRARKAIDSRLGRIFSVAAHGTATEQAARAHLVELAEQQLDAGPELGL